MKKKTENIKTQIHYLIKNSIKKTTLCRPGSSSIIKFMLTRHGNICLMSHLEKLTGRLAKVADDAFQGLALGLISYGVQIHGT